MRNKKELKIRNEKIILVILTVAVIIWTIININSIFKVMENVKKLEASKNENVVNTVVQGNIVTAEEIEENTNQLEIEDLKDKDKLVELRKKLGSINLTETAKALNVGEMTLKDIIDELSKPGRDPREDMPKPILRQDVLKFEDLKEGMILTGTVRNVIDFGAFVDIGVKHDGLVHISEMSEKFVKNPSDIVSVGDIVKVKVIGIDNERQKVKLSMKIG